jgi:phosphoribosylformimino-5-aminoimidazole carboxamide ribotide isomerase
MHGRPNYALLEELCQLKKVMVDAGLRSYAEVRRLAGLSCELIIATETLESLVTLERSIKEYGDRLLASLDIKNGSVVSKFLPHSTARAAEELVKAGIRKIIVLDISAVGTLGGVDYALIKPLIKAFPEVEFVVGGGIRKEDLGKLEGMGVKAVLVGTALHQGRLKA